MNDTSGGGNWRQAGCFLTLDVIELN